MAEIRKNPFRIGDWQIDPELGSIQRHDIVVKLEPKVMDLLLYLAQRPGKVLPREELEQQIWAGTVVGYDALTSAVIKIRKAFGDDSRNPWLIETLSKKGYRFIAPVSSHTEAPAPAATPSPGSETTPTAVTGRRRLHRILGAALVLAIVVAVSLLLRTPGPDSDSKPSIAILPFANLSSDTNFEYFSDGITDDVTTDLSKVSGLIVIAANSAYSYKNQPLSLKSVAESLKVRYVVEGSVRRAGDEIRISAKLIDTETGKHLWAERYDRQLKDIFSVQDNVTQNIVSALSITLTDDEKRRMVQRYTQSTEAYNLMLQGQSLYARSTREENARARELYMRAIDLDKKFARAYAALALTYAEDFRFGWSDKPQESLQHALTLAHKGVAIDDSIPHTSQVLGYVYLFQRDFTRAATAAEHAISIDPNNADAYTTLAFARVYQQRPEETITLVRKAMTLNPHYPAQYPSVLGRAYYHLGQHEQAITILREAIDKNPIRTPPRLYLILSYMALGKLDEAQWEVTQLRNGDPTFTLARFEKTIPVTDTGLLKRMKDDLRKAGLN